MIVNYSEKGWEVITQRAHGILAAQLAMHWKISRRPERWTELVLAIAEHDDAEVELDGENLLSLQGGPLNYDMKSFELAHCRKLADLSITKSRYIALLISMHMDFLYRHDKHKVPGAKLFLTQQQKLRGQLRNELAMNKKTAEKLYCFMEWFDACSLLLCQNKLPPEKRTVEISHLSDEIKYLLFQPEENVLSINPWPFESRTFSVHFETRLLPTIQFEDSAAFRKAFLTARVKEKIWTLKKTATIIKPKSKRI